MTTNIEALEAKVDALAQDMKTAMETLGRTADAVQQATGALGDLKATLPEDPDKMWKDAYARRDRAVAQRNELQQQVEDLKGQLDAARTEGGVIARREQTRYRLHTELQRRGVSKPEAALRLLDIGDAGLDSLCAEDGNLDAAGLDSLTTQLETRFPEFIATTIPSAIETPPAAVVISGEAAGNKGSASLQVFNRMYEAARREFDTN